MTRSSRRPAPPVRLVRLDPQGDRHPRSLRGHSNCGPRWHLRLRATCARVPVPTAFYSPEMCVLPAKAFHGRPADVWAAGVTLCMLVTGKLPFPADNMPEIWRKIQEEPPELPAQISEGLRELLLAMLSKTPEQRPTVAALRQHRWVTRDGAPLPSTLYPLPSTLYRLPCPPRRRLDALCDACHRLTSCASPPQVPSPWRTSRTRSLRSPMTTSRRR